MHLEYSVDVVSLIEVINDLFCSCRLGVVILGCAGGVEAHANCLHGQDVNEISQSHILLVGLNLLFKTDRLRLFASTQRGGFDACMRLDYIYVIRELRNELANLYTCISYRTLDIVFHKALKDAHHN